MEIYGVSHQEIERTRALCTLPLEKSGLSSRLISSGELATRTGHIFTCRSNFLWRNQLCGPEEASGLTPDVAITGRLG